MRLDYHSERPQISSFSAAAQIRSLLGKQRILTSPRCQTLFLGCLACGLTFLTLVPYLPAFVAFLVAPGSARSELAKQAIGQFLGMLAAPWIVAALICRTFQAHRNPRKVFAVVCVVIIAASFIESVQKTVQARSAERREISSSPASPKASPAENLSLNDLLTQLKQSKPAQVRQPVSRVPVVKSNVGQLEFVSASSEKDSSEAPAQTVTDFSASSNQTTANAKSAYSGYVLFLLTPEHGRDGKITSHVQNVIKSLEQDPNLFSGAYSSRKLSREDKASLQLDLYYCARVAHDFGSESLPAAIVMSADGRKKVIRPISVDSTEINQILRKWQS